MAFFGGSWNDRNDEDISNILEIDRLNKLVNQLQEELKKKDSLIETLRKLSKI